MEQSAASNHRDAAVLERQTRNLSQRTADRLNVAQDRHRAVLNQLDADTTRRQNAYQAETSKLEATWGQHVQATQGSVARAHRDIRQNEAAEEQWMSSKRHCMQHQAEARSEVDRNHAETTRNLLQAGERADAAIVASKAETRAKLEVLRQHRMNLQNKMNTDMQTRSAMQAGYVDDMRVKGSKREIKTEAYRHTSAMTCERVGEIAQAAKTGSQKQVDLLREKAIVQVVDMAKTAHETLVQTDSAVKEHLEGSAVELQAARDHCGQVRQEMAHEAAEYAEMMRQLELKQRAKDQDVEDKRLGLENDRVESFKAGCQFAQDAEARFRERRMACEAELDAVDRRLREIEQDTKRRAEEIMESWTSGNAAAEATVRSLEEQAETELKNMQSYVAEGERDKSQQNTELKQSSSEAVAALKDHGNQVLSDTQPTLEATREADEQAAAAAMQTVKSLRPEPGQIAAAADASVEAAMQRAREEDQRLQAESEANQEVAKAATRTAHQEEIYFKAEASEAWARLRKACFQLRLINLHDFAQGIVDGTFDLPPLEKELRMPLGTGLPVVLTA